MIKTTINTDPEQRKILELSLCEVLAAMALVFIDDHNAEDIRMVFKFGQGDSIFIGTIEVKAVEDNAQ